MLLAEDKDGDIPLQSAIRSMAPKDIIEHILKQKAAKDMLCSCNKKGQVPLNTAFYFRCWDIVEVILDKCIQYNQVPELTGVNAPADLKNNTLLHISFEKGSTKYFEIFLKVCRSRGIEGKQLLAALSIPNKKNETPWYHAIHSLGKKSFKKVLKSLQDSAIDINSLFTDPDTKSTMLHEAQRMNKHHHLLKRYGAKEIANANGILPCHRNRLIKQVSPNSCQ